MTAEREAPGAPRHQEGRAWSRRAALAGAQPARAPACREREAWRGGAGPRTGRKRPVCGRERAVQAQRAHRARKAHEGPAGLEAGEPGVQGLG
jgi:hypothetical protein